MLNTRTLLARALFLATTAVLAAGAALIAPGVAGAATKGSGPVDVYYAASLQDIMEQHVGPHFDKATGYSFTGFAGASGTLANEIKGKVVQGDVFISANASTNNTLMGEANGSWVTWYIAFGNSPLVLGYNPQSSFATVLRTEPWYKVITQPGFRIGRTDPTVDPKGKLTVQALTAAAQLYNTSALASITATTANVYPEASLVGELESGQLDAGFFYSSEAKAAGIPTVKLGKLDFAATYTVSVLQGAPHEAAALSFVNFLLSTPGVTLLKKEGLTVLKQPRLLGGLGVLPRPLRHLI